MKKMGIIFAFFGLFYLSFAFAKEVETTAYHDGTDGMQLLRNQTLFMQLTSTKPFFLTTNANGIFQLSTSYNNKLMRANLVDNGHIIAGCYSDLVPVGTKIIILRGVDCT